MSLVTLDGATPICVRQSNFIYSSGPLKSMSPKFTIQHMLWATLAFGFLATAMAAAYQGNMIAYGMLIAPLFMVVTFAVFAAIYWPCYFVCRMLYPAIHTPAAADFSAAQTTAENNIADSITTSPSSPAISGTPADTDVSEGASE